MNIYKILLIAILIAGFNSCSGDDDAPAPAPMQIANPVFSGDNVPGRYEITLLQSTEIEVEIRSSGTITTRTELSGRLFQNLNYTFNSDGSYSFTGQYVEDSTVTLSGNPPVMDNEILDVDRSGNYIVNDLGNELILSEDQGGTETFQVDFYDGSTLILTQNETDGQDSFEQRIELVKI